MLTKLLELIDGLFDQTVIITEVTTRQIKIVPDVPTDDGRFHLVTNPNPVGGEVHE